MSALSQPGIHELLLAACAVILYALAQRLVSRRGSLSRDVGPGKCWQLIQGGRPKLSGPSNSRYAPSVAMLAVKAPASEDLTLARCGQGRLGQVRLRLATKDCRGNQRDHQADREGFKERNRSVKERVFV